LPPGTTLSPSALDSVTLLTTTGRRVVLSVSQMPPCEGRVGAEDPAHDVRLHAVEQDHEDVVAR